MYLNDLSYALIRWLIAAVALLITAYIIPGFRVRSFGSALKAAFVIGLANAFVKPILLFLTLPLNILTLGLFTFVVNAMILKLAAALLRGFEITSWFSAILGGIILSLFGTLFHYVLFG